MNDIEDIISDAYENIADNYRRIIRPIKLTTFISKASKSGFNEFLDCVIDTKGRVYEVDISISNTLSHLAAQAKRLSYQRYLDTVPMNYYFNTDIYAMEVTKAISVRDEKQMGIVPPTKRQIQVLKKLKDAGLIYDNFVFVQSTHRSMFKTLVGTMES